MQRLYHEPINVGIVLLEDMNDPKKLEELLTIFFDGGENNQGIPQKITTKYGAKQLYTKEGLSVVVKSDRVQGDFEIYYQPKTSYMLANKLLNDLVDSELQIFLERAGYEVISFRKTGDVSPRRREIVVKINPYIVEAKKKNQQNNMLRKQIQREKQQKQTLEKTFNQTIQSLSLEVKKKIQEYEANKKQFALGA